MDDINRCFGGEPGKDLYRKYHDEEWAVPVHDDNKHFEMIILEGAQAGLSWEIVLKKRENYRRLFHGFIPEKVAYMNDEELELLLNSDSGIIRNRLKVYSTRLNARVFLQICAEQGSFNNYVWSFVGGKAIKNNWQTYEDLPAKTPQSDALSKDLKKRGMKFVGSTIIYAYMQAAGLVDDHLVSCHLHHQNR